MKKNILILEILFLVGLMAACGAVSENTSAPSTDENKYAKVVEEPFDNKIPVETHWDFEKQTFPLIAAIEENNIYMYAIKNNNSYGNEVVLYVGDTGHFYNLPFGTPRFRMPELWLSDFDGDGVNELAATNYYDSGTGISKEGLNIIKINESSGDRYDPWPIYTFEPEEYLEQLNSHISYKKDENSEYEYILNIAEKEYAIEIYSDLIEEGGVLTRLDVEGSIVDFYYEDNILKGRFVLSATFEKFATPKFLGDIYANCVFNSGNIFSLENISFKSN